MKDMNAIFAGFGGQGILFMGKAVAYAGLLQGKEVTWMPSYGPEMRGGTANCTVRLSDEPIDSPIIQTPNTLVVMNLPSYEQFIGRLSLGGIVVVDSFLVGKQVERTDVEAHYLPATKLAVEQGLDSLANLILMGKLMALTEFCTLDIMKKTIEAIVPAPKSYLVEKNIEAVLLGMNYQ